MSTSIRHISCLMGAVLLTACSDGVPSAPLDSAVGTPAMKILPGSSPTPEELATLPSEFSILPYITRRWTVVGFIPHEKRAFGQSFMEYWATDGRQDLKLDLRFENGPPISKHAQTARSDLVPATRTLWTTTHLGVMGECGHIADGTGTHAVWHKAIVSGWNLFRWGDNTETSNGSAFQPDCPPPPQDGEVDNGDGSGDGASPGGGEYQAECEMCQQWFYYIAGVIVDEWWECTPIDGSYCGLAAT